jgi:hypothetical protein
MKRKSSFRIMVAALVAGFVLLSLTVIADAIQGDKKVRLLDDCEPASFNAVLGDGACVGDGHTTFDQFIAELEKTQDAHAWRNQPTAMQLNVGRPLLIENRGGETHTLTPVAEYGGGFVNELNGISGNPVPAPECLNFGSIVFIPAGGVETGPVAGSPDLPVGVHKFQCCIHPWMRTLVVVASPPGKASATVPAAPATVSAVTEIASDAHHHH